MIQNQLSQRSGFSLLELLLSTFILAGILIIIFNVLENYADRLAAQSEAAYINKIADSVQEILNNPNYYQAIYTQADSQANKLIELTLNDLVNGFVANGVTIPPSNVLNANVQGDMNIIIRKSDTAAKQALAILIAYDEPKETRSAKRVASFLGENGGIYEGSTPNITNAFQSWQFPLTDIDNTTLLTQISSAPPTSDDIYYFYYKHIPFDYLTGDYLYRTAVAGRPELNQMFAPLNMGNNNILGADDITTNGNMTLSSSAIIDKQLTVRGDGLIRSGDLIVDGFVTTENALIKGLGVGKRGNLNVQGAINVGNTATVRSELNADSALLSNGLGTSGNVNVTNIISNGSIQSGNIFTTNFTTSDASSKQTVTVGKQIGVNTINVDQLNLQSGNVTAIDGIVLRNLNTQNGIKANNAEIDVLNTTVFGACDNGC